MNVIVGDCIQVMNGMDAESFDAVVTDPPYDLTASKKGGSGVASLNINSPAGRSRATTGFMGKSWDGTGIAFRPSTWGSVLRVLKPGAYLLAFGGSRTFHRLTCAIEDAGFEIRDCISYLYGSGFPKHRSALKPAWEPIVMARKPFPGAVASNVARHGTGTLNVDLCRIVHADEADRQSAIPQGRITSKSRHVGAQPDAGSDEARTDFEPSAFKRYKESGGTNFAASPGVRGGDPMGRWPSNVVLDEESARLLDEQGGDRGAFAPVLGTEPTSDGFSGPVYGTQNNRVSATFYADLGGASRFFYTSKASRAEREPGGIVGTRRINIHPTVKPLDLMEWLLRLVTPVGGVVLDPFCGSGSTLVAARRINIDAVGIEQDPASADIARQRIAGQVKVALL